MRDLVPGEAVEYSGCTSPGCASHPYGQPLGRLAKELVQVGDESRPVVSVGQNGKTQTSESDGPWRTDFHTAKERFRVNSSAFSKSRLPYRPARPNRSSLGYFLMVMASVTLGRTESVRGSGDMPSSTAGSGSVVGGIDAHVLKTRRIQPRAVPLEPSLGKLARSRKRARS